MLEKHSREQVGSTKYEFVMKIGAFPIRDLVSNGSINDTEQVLRYNQGGGLNLLSTHYKGINYIVQLKDIFTRRIQLYEKVTPNCVHPNFSSAAGCTQDPGVYGLIYKSFF